MGVHEFGRGPGTVMEGRVDHDREPVDSPGLRGSGPQEDTHSASPSPPCAWDSTVDASLSCWSACEGQASGGLCEAGPR